jgi:hypothetical protein
LPEDVGDQRVVTWWDAFSVSSRDEVDAGSAAALAAGGSEADDAEDYGFMFVPTSAWTTVGSDTITWGKWRHGSISNGTHASPPRARHPDSHSPPEVHRRQAESVCFEQKARVFAPRNGAAGPVVQKQHNLTGFTGAGGDV